ECSSQPVSKFFNGKSVERSIFIRICQELNLDVEQVTFTVNDEKIGSDLNASENLDIDILVQQVRQKIQPFILTQCGTMRVLDMSYPIGVDNIYTKVNILEKVTGQKRKNLSQLVEECDRHNHDRWQFSNINEPRVDGLKVVREHQQLIILGKPGAGKTTFLKHLAVKCLDRDSIFVNLVPFFVCLKDFAEADNKIGLEEYIAQQVTSYGISSSQIAYLINSGRTLILLDGLDEVREDDIKRVIKEIQTFSHKYSHNRFVITCRIAAQEYTFEKFTEVEIADFDDEQIELFARLWFKAKNIDLEQRFIKHLRNNPPIKELANRPILLTLLCLEFEDSGEFPSDLAELYRRAINTLLRKWDAKRGIYRDAVYKNLSTQRKEDLLSHIAKVTFEQQKYFFKQSELESYIADYIRNLSGSNIDEEALLVDSEAVLKSIEAQHGLLVERAKGIYSFSHLTIHEYFAARAIVGTANPNLSNDLSLIY
ncbi:MAG: NACHT domain-containing protein, partial [Cyanobacteria bacterium P01_A01_bin.84]